jgi:hypothetical protein
MLATECQCWMNSTAVQQHNSASCSPHMLVSMAQSHGQTIHTTWPHMYMHV